MSILPSLILFVAGIAPTAGMFDRERSISGEAYRPLPEHLVQVQAQAGAEGFTAWKGEFKSRAIKAGVAGKTVDAALKGVRYNKQIIQLDRKQSDFTRTIGAYLERAVTRDRVVVGKKMLARHEAVLNKIAARYSVEKEVVVAIWGLETSYGGYMGKSSTIRSLATLAYDGRRSAFFENELIEALKILENGDIAVSKMNGSWAGAMGHTQFMPSSFNAYAVDFDRDGRRDIWSKDPTDALASAAAYLQHFGWIAGQAWSVEVQLPEGFDLRLANPGIQKTPTEWAALGLRGVSDEALSGTGPASLFLPAGKDGPALMIAQNFEALRRYNLTPTYIMSVGLLSDALAGRSDSFAQAWPDDARLLSLADRKEMQALLLEAGFDPGRLDGKLDAGVISAVQAYQSAKGAPPDGNPSPAFLTALRQSGEN